jgi:hypothetical protein
MFFCAVTAYTRAFGKKRPALHFLIRLANKFYQNSPDFMTSEMGHPVHSPFVKEPIKKLLYTCAVAYNHINYYYCYCYC